LFFSNGPCQMFALNAKPWLSPRALIDFCVLLCCITLLSSCLRYVPSRRELEEEARANGQNNLSVTVGGPQEFWAHEKKLAARLNELVKARSSLVAFGNADLYHIGPGDQLELQVYGLSELSTSSQVAPDGTFTVALLGPIAAQGKTLSELREDLTEALRPYVRSPRLTLAITQYAANRVSVIGAVAKPGVYPLRRQGDTLTELLSVAGGRTDRAGTRIVLSPPNATGSGQGASSPAAQKSSRDFPPLGYGVELDISDLMGTADRPPLRVPLVAGDTIIVPEAGTFKVDGEVTRGGVFPISGRTTALGAVAAAEGFTYSANVHEVEVVRDLGNGKKASLVLDLEKVALNGAPDVPLRDGDLVRVPSARARFNTRQVVEAVNGLFRTSVGASVKY
jgi:polysaccharide export outer membrane protein